MVLVLLVRQMEATRTPSTLAKVSLWTIVILGVTDSWIFSAHLVIGVMTDNKTGLPMLVPGFCALCTAIVFGPVSRVDMCSGRAVLPGVAHQGRCSSTV